MRVEILKKGVAMIEKDLEELFEKGSLNPSETQNAKNAMELREYLLCTIDECMAKEDAEKYSERGYSHHGETPYRQYHITSYGMPHMYSMNSMRPAYDPRMDWAGDYGVQGWYRSGDGMSNYGPEYSERGRGTSRHSIGDRVVAMMEKEMDTTESPYEKEELKKFIRMVRSAADN